MPSRSSEHPELDPEFSRELAGFFCRILKTQRLGGAEEFNLAEIQTINFITT